MISKLFYQMRIAITISLISLSGSICLAQTGQNAAKPGSDILMQVDLDFAKMASDSGIAQAFAFFAADSATILKRGSAPVVGREVIRQLYNDTTGSTLQWAPYFADLAASGDLGYTVGKYEFLYKNSKGAQKSSPGYYVTIWKKQLDGSWKYVLDTGVAAPPPPEADSTAKH